MERTNRGATQVLTEGEKPAARGPERALSATASHPRSESPTRLAGSLTEQRGGTQQKTAIMEKHIAVHPVNRENGELI